MVMYVSPILVNRNDCHYSGTTTEYVVHIVHPPWICHPCIGPCPIRLTDALLFTMASHRTEFMELLWSYCCCNHPIVTLIGCKLISALLSPSRCPRFPEYYGIDVTLWVVCILGHVVITISIEYLATHSPDFEEFLNM